MTSDSRGRHIAWLVLVVVSLANYGNYYIYDSIGPVADLLHRQRSFSDSQIGMLNAIYSLPNILLLLFGGMLVDRFGSARMMFWTGVLCLAGSILTAFSPDFGTMAAGRLLLGVGSETFNVATMAAIVKYFSGRNLAFAVGVGVAIGRVGSFSADMSPTWFSTAYSGGWQPPLIIAAALAALSVVASAIFWWLDHKHGHPDPNAGRATEPISMRAISSFGSVYWCLLVLCVLWFSVIFAFRSTFSIKYFQHAHGLDLEAAGAINACVFLAALFATPAFGWVCDRTGRYTPMLAFGALLLPISIAIMALTHGSLWPSTVLIGISFSLVPAVMWPLTAKIVPEANFGTALGLMWVIQNAGIAVANLVAGWLNDRYAASAENPSGYEPMMLFFFILSALGFVFAMLLWWRMGRRITNPSMRSNPPTGRSL
jgi:MFS family permease